MIKRAVLWTAIGTGFAAFAVILFLASGFRLFAILSPSMGTTAPVGSLVVSHPADSYAVGDIITFDRGPRVYTHRIVGIPEVGSYTTRGDLNGSDDPLPVAASDVIGKASWIAPGLGWLLRGLPWLVVGGVIVSLLSLIGSMERPWRWVLRISGWTLVFALVAVWLRPWINLEMLGFVPADRGGGVMMHVVNTGLFPLDANGTRLVSGQDTVLHVTEQNSAGRFTLTPGPALNLWERILLTLFCLIPLAASFLVRKEQIPAPATEPAAAHPRRRKVLIGAVVVAVVVSVATVNQTIAYGSYAARIQNSTSTAGSRTFFNCRNAISSLGAASTYAAWAAGTARATNADEPDLSGNTSQRTGRFTTAAVVSTSIGCLRDTPARSITFAGDKCLYVNNNYASSGYHPNTFSIEAWFRTGTKSNGKIIGFGNIRNAATDTTYDRHIYIDKDGRVVFGVYPNEVKIVSTPAGKDFADNNWHHAIATLSSAGQYLYVDGALVGSNPAVTSAEALHGYWKVGCGNLTSWRNAGSTSNDDNGPAFFTGQIQYAAVYSVALTATQVLEHYLAGVA